MKKKNVSVWRSRSKTALTWNMHELEHHIEVSSLGFQVRRYSVPISPLYQPLSQAWHQRPWQTLPMSDLWSQIHTHSKPEAAHAHTLRYVNWGKEKLETRWNFACLSWEPLECNCAIVFCRVKFKTHPPTTIMQLLKKTDWLRSVDRILDFK